jgi:hypothetical protein
MLTSVWSGWRDKPLLFMLIAKPNIETDRNITYENVD